MTKHLRNTLDNRITVCEAEIKAIADELKKPNNFIKNKHFVYSNIKQEGESNGSRIPDDQLQSEESLRHSS